MDAPGPAPTAPGPPPPNMLSRLLRPGGPPGATSPGGIIGAADPRPRSVRRSRCADIADMADIAAAALDAASGSGARAFAAFCDPGRPGKSPPRLGHPVLGGSANPFPAAAPRRFTSAASKSSSVSAHTTRPTASVPSLSALSTLGKLRRCTARATLSPAANGSSTPRQ